LAFVAAALAAQRRSVHGLLREPGFSTIEVPADWPERTWTNLNHPADLAAFLRKGT
jgi:molybdopterin-guanine dinucleotide biosynthesis protein A